MVQHLSGRINYMSINTLNPLLAKPLVRLAIKWAIDYEGIQKNIMPVTSKVHQAFLPESFTGAITDAPFFKHAAKARALLTQAGYPDGIDLTLDHASAPPMPDIAQIIQANLRDAGIRVSLQTAEARLVTTRIRARLHQLALGSWGTDYFDPHSNAENFCINVDNSDASFRKTTAWRGLVLGTMSDLSRYEGLKKT